MSDYRINIRSEVPDAESIESSDSLFGLFGGDFAKITFEQLFRKFVEDDTVANSEITITESEGKTQTTITVVEAVQYLFDGLKELDDNKASKTIYIGKIKYSVDEIITEIANKLQSNTSFVRSLMLKNEYFGNITDVSDLSILLQNAPDEIKNDFRGDMYKIVHVLLNIIKKVKEYASHSSGGGGGAPAEHAHSVNDIYKATTVGGSWNSNFADIRPDVAEAISCNPDFVQYITEERNKSIEDFIEDYGIFMQGGEPVTDSSGNNWFILICGLINRTIKEKVAPKSSLYDMQYGNVVKLLGEVESAEDLDKVVLSASDKDVHFVLGDTAIDNLIITDKIELFTLLAGGGLDPQSPEDVDSLVAKYGNKAITISIQQANEDGTPLDVDGMSISDFYKSDSLLYNFMTQCFLIVSEDIVAPIMEAESDEEAMSQFKFSIEEIEAESIFKTPLLKIVAGTANTASNAQGTAEQAQSTAEYARSTAEYAQNTANNAQGTAEQAQSTAEQAQNAANNAQSTANIAQSTAEQAQSTAEQAQSTAEQAQSTANNAQSILAERYTNAEINNLVSSIPKFSIKVVNVLPVSDISTTTVYLLAKQNPESSNLYTEYIYVNDNWEKLGEQTLDLSDYYKKQQTDSLVNEAKTLANNAQTKANSAYDLAITKQTAAQVQTLISNAVANFLTESQIRAIVQEMIESAIAAKVSSQTINNIERVTQTEYEDIAIKDDKTLYIVIEDEEEVVTND